MNIKIGPYTITQRTEYSKIQVLNEKQENISSTLVGNKIIEDYKAQKNTPEKFFKINDNVLYMFVGHTTIEYVFVPDEIEAIDKYAFEGSKIIYINIPNTVKYIGNGAFENCKKLEEIYLPNTITALNNWNLFAGDENLKTVHLPEALTCIPRFAFYNCVSLKNINMPEKLTEIEESAFAYCNKLENITLPDTLSEVWNHVFSGCTQLKSINIPKKLTHLGVRSFEQSGLKTMFINHDIKDLYLDAYDNGLNYTNIDKIVIDSNVHFINKKLFSEIETQITTLEYIGTKKQFNEFKKTNQEFIKKFNNAKIKIIDKNLDEKIKNNKSNPITKLVRNIIER